MADKDHPLRIAMLGHKRVPSREGGVEIVVEELAVRMAARGHRVTCFNRSRRRDPAPVADTYRGVTLRRVPTLDRRGLAALTASFFATLRASLGRYDVVHFHAEGPAFLCWLPRLLGKRVVVTIHGLDWARAKWGRFASWYIKTGERNAVRFAHEIIVLSENARQYFAQTYGRQTLRIPNGVSRPRLLPAREITARWGLEKDSYVLYLGRLVPEKGVHYLLSAYAAIPTDIRLVIVGESSDTDDYARALRAAAGDNVIFTGFQQGELLGELFSNARAYCLPSDLEGMPLSLLEAMSYGNSCLVSGIAECTEVTEDMAAVFDRGSVDSLRSHLEALLAAPAPTAEQRQRIADYICGKYSWDDVTERTLAVYTGR